MFRLGSKRRKSVLAVVRKMNINRVGEISMNNGRGKSKDLFTVNSEIRSEK